MHTDDRFDNSTSERLGASNFLVTALIYLHIPAISLSPKNQSKGDVHADGSSLFFSIWLASFAPGPNSCALSVAPGDRI